MSIDHISDEFGYWFAGFVDGEGCFYAGMQNPYVDKRGYAHNVNLQIFFNLTLRADDLPLLETIKKTLGCGRLNVKKYQNRKSPHGGKPQAVYNVNANIEHRQVIVPLFDKYKLKSKKARDFKTWKQIVLRGKGVGGRYPDRNWGEIRRLVAKLRSERAYDYDPILAAEIEAQHTPTPQWEQQGLFQ